MLFLNISELGIVASSPTFCAEQVYSNASAESASEPQARWTSIASVFLPLGNIDTRVFCDTLRLDTRKGGH